MEIFEMGMKNRRQELLDRKSTLEDEIKKIDSELNQLDSENNENSSKDERRPESKEEIFYCDLKALGSRALHKSSKNDTSFKVFDIEGNMAKFEYCGRVVSIDYLTDVSSFTNNPYEIENKKRIITVSPGTVQKDGDNNWVVIEKTKIKFE